MLRAISNYFITIPSMFIDGTLYVLIAIFTFLATFFGTDEAAKYVSDVWLFWLKCVIGTFSSTLLAIKMFRSTAFAEHQETKKANEVTVVNK